MAEDPSAWRILYPVGGAGGMMRDGGEGGGLEAHGVGLAWSPDVEELGLAVLAAALPLPCSILWTWFFPKLDPPGADPSPGCA